MARPVKCPHCNQSFDRDKVSFKQHNKRYYHEACYNIMIYGAKQYKNLIDFICHIRGWKAPTGFVIKQIKEFKDTMGYTDAGIQVAVYYHYRVLGNPIPTDDKIGIGFVRYVYDEAQKYVKDLSATNQHNNDAKIDTTPRSVKVKRTNSSYKKRKIVDLEELI